MSEFESFEAVISSLPKPAPVQMEEKTFTIALGDYFEGSKAVLTFYKMKASLLFGNTLSTLVERILFQKCKEDEETILEMAFIIGCHKEPAAKSPALLVPGYIQLFADLTESQKWQFVQEFKEKGSAEFIGKMNELTMAKKNSSKTATPLTAPDLKSLDLASDTLSATRPKPTSRPTSSRKSPRTTR